jgi:hypothetical protein
LRDLHLGIDREHVDPLKRHGTHPRYHARLSSIANTCLTDHAPTPPHAMMARVERKRNRDVMANVG